MKTSLPSVLLILFNRPDLTQKLISILRSVRPPKVYVAIDGPRADRPEDEQKVGEVRKIAHSMDWTKQVQFLIRENNLGCGEGPSSAIDWFFEQEEQGIILEDDIHPSADFFPFCQEMLTRYAEDKRVATILGHSFTPSSLQHPRGYFFSQYFQGWGWATWRRFWKTYDFHLTSLPQKEWEKIIEDHSDGRLETAYWLSSLYEVLQKKHAWDFQAQFCIWRNQQVNIIAGSNLISNEGFREDGTNTLSSMGKNLACRKTVPLSGPFPEQEVKADAEMDRRNFMFQYIMNENHLFTLARLLDPEVQKLRLENMELQQKLMNLR